MSKKKTIRLLSWNVNGLRAAHRKGYVEWLKEAQPDIIGLQEIKAKEEQLVDEIKHIEGYHSFYAPAERPGYSGVAVYSKLTPRKVERGLGIKRFDVEGRTIKIDYGDFIFFTIYFPNGRKDAERLKYKMDFYDAYLKEAKKLVKQGKNVIMCGDVNTAHHEIDLARPVPNMKHSGFLPEERAWMDKLVKSGFVDTFRMFNDEPDNYSWWDMQTRARDRNIGWRIDYFFVNEGFKHRVKDAFIMPEVYGSDHCPVGIDILI